MDNMWQNTSTDSNDNCYRTLIDLSARGHDRDFEVSDGAVYVPLRALPLGF